MLGRTIAFTSLISLLCATGAAQDSAPASQPSDLSVVYRAQAERIIASVRSGTDGYRKLSQLCQEIGHRLSGSPGLERAVAWAQETLKRDGQENVRAEPVEVVKWVRGSESLELIAPRPARLPMLGLGGSIGTPPEGITADVISVPSHEALDELDEKARGKIVLFDVAMPTENAERGAGYGTAAQYRYMGARWATSVGAVAALVRSPTTRSMRTPHTGGMNYFEANPRIPAAAISTEDADMITRLVKQGVPVRATLRMEARTEPKPAPSANVVGELRGRERPDEIVVIGGHLDSWDVGQGAHDDGGGCVMAIEALNVLRKLDLRPRRTIRVVLFTNEENGLAGGRGYLAAHTDEMPVHAAAIESDNGTFALRGFSLQLENEAVRPLGLYQITQIVRLLQPLGRCDAELGGSGADVGPMSKFNVPLLGQRVDMTHYFDFHHTEADTIDKVDPKDLDQNIAAMAIVAFVLADMPGRLGEAEWREKR